MEASSYLYARYGWYRATVGARDVAAGLGSFSCKGKVHTMTDMRRVFSLCCSYATIAFSKKYIYSVLELALNFNTKEHLYIETY